MSGPAGSGPGRQPAVLRCPRCEAPVAPGQDWCLECGDAARTRLAPAPNWRMPIALIAAIAILAGLAIGVAFVALTDDDEPVAAATSPTGPTGPVTEPVVTTAPPAVAPVQTTTTTVPTPPPATVTTPSTTPTVTGPTSTSAD